MKISLIILIGSLFLIFQKEGPTDFAKVKKSKYLLIDTNKYYISEETPITECAIYYLGNKLSPKKFRNHLACINDFYANVLYNYYIEIYFEKPCTGEGFYSYMMCKRDKSFKNRIGFNRHLTPEYEKFLSLSKGESVTQIYYENYKLLADRSPLKTYWIIELE
jgi:hypothetical protein